MKERILHFLARENKSSSQFAAEIGVQPSSISHILSGRNKPSLDFVVKMLSKYAELNSEWLLFGRGDMYKGDNEPSLFNNFDIKTEDSPREKDISAIMAESKEIFDEIKPLTESEGPEKSDSIKKTRKIVVFYNDNTFTEFCPE